MDLKSLVPQRTYLINREINIITRTVIPRLLGKPRVLTLSVYCDINLRTIALKLLTNYSLTQISY